MTHRFQINLRGIIDLLSNHLYSRPEVFVRELLQNAVDAITARQQFTPKHSGEITLATTTPRGKPPTLEVTDNGIGLTEDEIHRFLATVGETSKRDADGRRTGDFLGQFGIGLLSCFVVSDEIVVVTQCAREKSPAVEWRGRSDGTYVVRASTLTSPRERRSTSRVVPAKRNCSATTPSRICASLRSPLALSHPRKDQPHQSRRERRGMPVATRLFWGKGPHSGGVALRQAGFRDRLSGRDPTALARQSGWRCVCLAAPANLSTRRAHRVYLRNMLLSEDADNLLPDWAFFVKAIVNAGDLRPTASRENFFEDNRLEAVRVELGNCLRDYMVHLAEQESSRFARFLAVHHLALKAPGGSGRRVLPAVH